MLAIGFDPSFIDILVRVENKHGNLLEHLPKSGFHNRFSKITKIAGGNGVNICAVLGKLGLDHILVVPINEEFKRLLADRNITKSFSISEEINITVALTWKEGDIQFNQATTRLGIDEWTQEVHDLWVNSPVGTMINWGLNDNSHEWVACQLLASGGFSASEIHESDDVLGLAKSVDEVRQTLLIEPGKYFHQANAKKLDTLLQHLGKLSLKSDKKCILLYNEEEKPHFSQFTFAQKILHTAKKVIYSNYEENLTFDVPTLETDPITFVGAGDAFFAGIIDSLLKEKIDIDHAILVAQQYLAAKL